MSEVVFEQKLELLDRFVGKTLADKYKIIKEWRDSGLGKVYHAKHLLMDKPVAVKVLSPALAVDVKIVNRFSAEARTVSGLTHQNILNVTDFGSTNDGTVFIVFEDAEGETVNDVIKNGGDFEVERAVGIARQIANVLAESHSKGVIHKHLSSETILLTQSPNGSNGVKVLDFGAVKPEDDGMFAEEPAANDLKYLSPEQLSGAFEVDERSDIYSLGVILYEMLALEVPCAGDSAEEILKKQTENPPLPLSAFRGDIPDGLETVLLRALSNNPDMRYQKAAAFAEDLLPFSGVLADSELAAVPAAASPEIKNNIWKTAFVVLAGISLLAVGLIYATYTKQSDPATMLQTDANGLPVQPLNPATGINEQNLIYTGDGTMPEIVGNSSDQLSGVAPGGDGYDPWARGGIPPAGAPTYPNGGQVITIPGEGGGSQFMPGLDGSGGIILIPVPVNSNTSTNPTPKPTKTPLPSNSQVTPNDPTDTKPDQKPTPAPTKPAAKPVDEKAKPPGASNDKSAKSGKEQDAN